MEQHPEQVVYPKRIRYEVYVPARSGKGVVHIGYVTLTPEEAERRRQHGAILRESMKIVPH